MRVSLCVLVYVRKRERTVDKEKEKSNSAEDAEVEEHILGYFPCHRKDV